MPIDTNDPAFRKAVADGVKAELAIRDKEAKKGKDPTTLAELIDRISDASADKVMGRLAEGEDDEGQGSGGLSLVERLLGQGRAS